MASSIDAAIPTNTLRPALFKKELRANFAVAKSEVGALQTDVGALQTDVGALQTDVGALQTTVGGLNLLSVVSDVTGLLTGAAHSGKVLVTSGNITVPKTAGFNAYVVAGDAHTVTFDGKTSAAMAAGDVMHVIVPTTTTIFAQLVPVASQVEFTAE